MVILLLYIVLHIFSTMQSKKLITEEMIAVFLGSDWFKHSGCDCRSLRMQMVTIFSGFKKFVWLVRRLKIGAFVGYLWLVNYQIQQQLNNK